MIKRGLQYSHILWRRTKLHHYFGVESVKDPYYILGVDKNAQYPQIKKAFYKLANQYHPDKTADDKEANKKFMLVKEAFQNIKLHKGITKPKGFVYDSDVSSVRPDPSRFDTDDEQNMHKNADYKMYSERAEASEEYEQFRGTFKTLNDINDLKIRVEEGEMKDSTSRFGLQNFRAKIQKIKGSGFTYFFMITIGAISFYVSTSKAMDHNQEVQIEKGLEQQQRKFTSRKLLDREDQEKDVFFSSMEKSQDVQQFIKVKEKLDKNMKKKHSYSKKKEEIVSDDMESV